MFSHGVALVGLELFVHDRNVEESCPPGARAVRRAAQSFRPDAESENARITWVLRRVDASVCL